MPNPAIDVSSTLQYSYVDPIEVSHKRKRNIKQKHSDLDTKVMTTSISSESLTSSLESHLVSHSFIFPSQDAEARMNSSIGDHSTHVTPEECPLSTCVQSPHEGSHSLSKKCSAESGLRILTEVKR